MRKLVLVLAQIIFLTAPALCQPRYDDDYRDRRDYYRDERLDDYDRRELERERDKLRRDRDRLEYERDRLEAERERPAAPPEPQRPPPPPPPPGGAPRCPHGFTQSEQKCSVEERRRGCKDMRLPSGLGCVKR